MVDVIRLSRDENPVADARREWLVTNGLGGFASATISGEITRRYHGFLIAALPAPLGRMVMLNDLEVEIELRRRHASPTCATPGPVSRFTLAMGLPSWRYEIDGIVIEKSVVVPARHNIVHITFRLLGDRAGASGCGSGPSSIFAALEAPVSEALAADYALTVRGRAIRGRRRARSADLAAGDGRLRGPTFTADGGSRRECLFRPRRSAVTMRAAGCGAPAISPARSGKDCPLTLIAATEPWHTMLALSPDDALTFEGERRRRLVAMAVPPARSGFAAELVLAADTFVITPVGRIADIARAQAEGDEVRTVIAGYHWFTDWGRDTMISLEGLTLATGRAIEAGWILRTFAHYVRDGLIPNMFPEGHNQGLYHTADATLWFFHALHRYVEHTDDKTTLELILPILKDIVRHHLEGTRFGIKVDPHDGLLRQGAEGYQLTWMDAKVGDWVVTPRRGKAVEINALWYNALCLLADWLRAAQRSGSRRIRRACRQGAGIVQPPLLVREGGYLYDVVDGENGDEPSFRPNQIFAISLDHRCSMGRIGTRW